MAAGVGHLSLIVWFSLQLLPSAGTNTVTLLSRCGGIYRVRSWLTVSLGRPHVTESSGNFTCLVVFIAPEDEDRLQFKFDFMKVDCNTDKITIYDGYNNSAPILDSLCGFSSPQRVITSSNRAYVSFYSQNYGSNSNFEIYVELADSPVVEADTRQNFVFIAIAVATGALFLAVAIGMCCCVYTSRKKEQQRRLRRRQRRRTLQLQMTLELSEGVNNPSGPPPTPDRTAPAYTPPCAPPPYSTLPRRHSSNDYSDTANDVSISQETNVDGGEHPPPYDEHM